MVITKKGAKMYKLILSIIVVILFLMIGYHLVNWPKMQKLDIVGNVPSRMAGSSKRAELTLYAASWCGACKFFRPVWNSLIKEYEKDDRISFKEVDCTNTDVAKQILDNTLLEDGSKIQGYPTVTIHLGEGRPRVFAGPSDTLVQLKEKINSIVN